MKHLTLTNGGLQEVTIIEERNLYRLMCRSNAPNAEPFQDWLYGVVLPSIHKLDLATNELVDLAKRGSRHILIRRLSRLKKPGVWMDQQKKKRCQ